MQFIPVGMMHSHEEHSENSVYVDGSHETEHADHFNDTSDSDFHFKVADDCDLCDLLLSLHDQSLSFGTVQEYHFDFKDASSTATLQSGAIAEVLHATSGRAPPRA